MLPEKPADVGQTDLRCIGPAVSTGQWELEIHFAQSIGQSDLAQCQSVGQRAQRCVMHRDQGRRQIVGSNVDRPPHRVRVDLRAEFGRQIRGNRVGGLQHRMDQGAEFRSCRQVCHRRRQIRFQRRSHQSDVGYLVVEFDHLGFAAHPGILLS